MVGWIVCTMLLGLVACSPTAKPVSDPEHSRKALTDVQLKCRADESYGIGHLSLRLGPRCQGPVTRLALDAFDFGTFMGESAARQYRLATTALCLCAYGTCSEANRDAALATASQLNEQRELADAKVVSEMQTITTSDCVNQTIAVELYKIGSACGYAVGLDSPKLRDRMDEAFTIAFADKATAITLANRCWSGTGSLGDDQPPVD